MNSTWGSSSSPMIWASMAQTADKRGGDVSGPDDLKSGPGSRCDPQRPQHPYTQGLLDALPKLDDLDAPLTPDGRVTSPRPLERPSGLCVFTRATSTLKVMARDICKTEVHPDD